MRVLVTGGAGYIGCISVRLLLDRGHEVVVLDTLERGHARSVDGRATLVVGDVGDRRVIDQAMAGCDAVLHLAGYTLVEESEREPDRYFDNNVERPSHLLEAVVDHRVRSFVFSSTAAVYGEPSVVPIAEDAPTQPVNVYGGSKLEFEYLLEHVRSRGLFENIRLRYFNAAGAWPDGSLGEDHEPETHLIPRVLTAIAEGRRSLEVYGGDYPTPDRTCVRDYIHVLDLAEAHLLALERLHAGGTGGVFNLGNGRGFSNLEVVRECAEVTGQEIEVKIGPRRAGDPAALVASNVRAVRKLGWRPERAGLQTIVADAWRWHSSHPRGYRA